MADCRHELKFKIDPINLHILRGRLCAAMKHDAHASRDGTYLIRSLYFDTDTDRALREKTEGLAHHEKFRIRYYNYDTSFIRLEKKMKCGHLTQKHSAPLTEAQCRRLLLDDTAFLLETGDPLHKELYARMKLQGYKKRVVVDYRRESFVCPIADTRITFDTDIKTSIRTTDFLDFALPMIPCDAVRGHEEPPLAVLEVKYNAFLPGHIAAMIQCEGLRQAPFSKYEISRRYD